MYSRAVIAINVGVAAGLRTALTLRTLLDADLMLTLPANIHHGAEEVRQRNEHGHQVAQAEVDCQPREDSDVHGGGLTRNWERHHDNDNANDVLDGQGEAKSINAQRLQREHFVTEAQVEVHAMEVAEEFADGADNDPVDDPIVSCVEGNDEESDEEGPHGEDDHMALHILEADEGVEHFDQREELRDLVDKPDIALQLGIAVDEWFGEAKRLGRQLNQQIEGQEESSRIVCDKIGLFGYLRIFVGELKHF